MSGKKIKHLKRDSHGVLVESHLKRLGKSMNISDRIIRVVAETETWYIQVRKRRGDLPDENIYKRNEKAISGRKPVALFPKAA